MLNRVVLLALLAALASCNQPKETEVSAVAESGAIMDAEAEALPELPTHWLNDKPIGRGAGSSNPG